MTPPEISLVYDQEVPFPCTIMLTNSPGRAYTCMAFDSPNSSAIGVPMQARLVSFDVEGGVFTFIPCDLDCQNQGYPNAACTACVCQTHHHSGILCHENQVVNGTQQGASGILLSTILHNLLLEVGLAQVESDQVLNSIARRYVDDLSPLVARDFEVQRLRATAVDIWFPAAVTSESPLQLTIDANDLQGIDPSALTRIHVRLKAKDRAWARELIDEGDSELRLVFFD